MNVNRYPESCTNVLNTIDVANTQTCWLKSSVTVLSPVEESKSSQDTSRGNDVTEAKD